MESGDLTTSSAAVVDPPAKEPISEQVSGDTHTQHLPFRCTNPHCPRVCELPGSFELCEQCYQCFLRGDFCCYCRQIYTSEDDGESWVECQLCNKWVHTLCELGAGTRECVGEDGGWADYSCPRCRSERKAARSGVAPGPQPRGNLRERQRLEQYIELSFRKNEVNVKSGKRKEGELRVALSEEAKGQDISFFRELL